MCVTAVANVDRSSPSDEACSRDSPFEWPACPRNGVTITQTFADLSVPAGLVARLAARGITTPFPIQASMLPDALAGHDVCGRAPTGSGKTLVFALAIATRAKQGASRKPSALVLVPTRELAAQVHEELAALAPGGAKRVVAVYGGVGYGEQRRALRKGANVVVACPGRLEDLVAQGDIDLSAVDMVVLDEADRMCDMGFLPAVRRLLDQTSPKRQTLLFSATLDDDVAKIVKHYQHDPRRHDVVDESRPEDVTHLFWQTERAHKVRLTADLVGKHGSVVVFCRTRHGADRVARQLVQAGVRAVAIHGSRTQPQRQRALADFAAGRATALVATDVAARGIHVDKVGCVVHFDPPQDAKDYVHRSGRTGRAGESGTVVSLVTPDEHAALGTLQKALGLSPQLGLPSGEAVQLSRPRRHGPNAPGGQRHNRRTSHNRRRPN
jgi:superfamily II DNA/RNA helicase